MEADTGLVIEAREVEQIPVEEHHGKLKGGKTNIRTFLTYVEDRWHARSRETTSDRPNNNNFR